MNIQTDTVRTGRKLTQVLQGAREVFMRDGFEGASVDAIAREVLDLAPFAARDAVTDDGDPFAEAVE